MVLQSFTWVPNQVTVPPGGEIPTGHITGNAPHGDKAGFRKSSARQWRRSGCATKWLQHGVR